MCSSTLTFTDFGAPIVNEVFPCSAPLIGIVRRPVIQRHLRAIDIGAVGSGDGELLGKGCERRLRVGERDDAQQAWIVKSAVCSAR